MDNLYLDTHFFAVANRLVWDNWAKFMGAQEDPGDSTDFTIPVLDGAHAVLAGDVGDYMGLPLGLDPAVTADVSSLPFRAYRLIWNTWMRDQNLQDSLQVKTNDGPDSNTEVGFGDPPLARGKRHDYFTSCLPWPAKTNTPVTLPLGTVAPIISATGLSSGDDVVITDADTPATSVWDFNSGIPAKLEFGAQLAGSANIFADLTNATAATVNDFREALTVQHLYEIDARGGTRLQEVILAHFNVRGDDARLNRPEYLGGGSQHISITQVPQTSEDGTTPQGHLTGYGTANISGHGFTKI